MRQRVDSEARSKVKPTNPASDSLSCKMTKSYGSSTPVRKLSAPLGPDPAKGADVAKVGGRGPVTTTLRDRSPRKAYTDLKLDTIMLSDWKMSVTHNDKIDKHAKEREGLSPSLHNNAKLRRMRSDISDLITSGLDRVSIDSPKSHSPPASFNFPSIYPSISSISSSNYSSSSTYTPTSCPSSLSYTRKISLDEPVHSPTSPPSSSNITANSFESLSCQEQETTIMFLRQCLTSLDTMESSILSKEEGSHNTSSTNEGNKTESSCDLSKQTLMVVFTRAIEALGDAD